MALGIQKHIPSAVSTHPRLLPVRPLPEQVQLGTELGGAVWRDLLSPRAVGLSSAGTWAG